MLLDLQNLRDIFMYKIPTVHNHICIKNIKYENCIPKRVITRVTRRMTTVDRTRSSLDYRVRIICILLYTGRNFTVEQADPVSFVKSAITLV